ncbi:MAG: hypothetical protein ACP5OZ_02625 [Candidatus Woesearchaeota archaeon]
MKVKKEFAIFIIFYIIFALFSNYKGGNENVRIHLTRAIVEDNSIKINKYANTTNDKIIINGDVYCDKAPLISFISIPAYIFYKEIFNKKLGWEIQTNNEYNPLLVFLFLLITSIPFSALTVVLLYKILSLYTKNEKIKFITILSYGCGSIAFSQATFFMGHNIGAFFLLSSFYQILKHKIKKEKFNYLLFGMMLSLGFWTDIIVLPLVLPFILYFVIEKKYSELIKSLVIIFIFLFLFFLYSPTKFIILRNLRILSYNPETNVYAGFYTPIVHFGDSRGIYIFDYIFKKPKDSLEIIYDDQREMVTEISTNLKDKTILETYINNKTEILILNKVDYKSVNKSYYELIKMHKGNDFYEIYYSNDKNNWIKYCDYKRSNLGYTCKINDFLVINSKMPLIYFKEDFYKISEKDLGDCSFLYLYEGKTIDVIKCKYNLTFEKNDNIIILKIDRIFLPPSPLIFILVILSKIIRLLFYPFRGLFFYSPISFLGFLSIFLLRKKDKKIFLLTLLVFLFNIFIAASIIYWWGGDSFGPRYLALTLPLLFCFMPMLFKKINKRLFYVILFISLIINFSGMQALPNDQMVFFDKEIGNFKITYGYTLIHFKPFGNPLYEYYLPLFFSRGPKSILLERIFKKTFIPYSNLIIAILLLGLLYYYSTKNS